MKHSIISEVDLQKLPYLDQTVHQQVKFHFKTSPTGFYCLLHVTCPMPFLDIVLSSSSSCCNLLNFLWNSSKIFKWYFEHVYLIPAQIMRPNFKFSKMQFLALWKNLKLSKNLTRHVSLVLKILWSHRILITLVIHIDSSSWLLCSPSVNNINTEQPAPFALLTLHKISNRSKKVLWGCISSCKFFH